MADVKLLACKDCALVVDVAFGEADHLKCGEQELAVLEAGAVDAAKEKHVPEVKREGNHLSVKVGSVLHPMEEKHYITFILVKQDNRTYRIDLKPGEEPVAEFDIQDGPATVYEYCNLHGLWKADC